MAPSQQVQNFGKDKRLLTKGDYQRVFKNAICMKTPHANWYISRVEGQQGRLGLVLMKKAIKRATDRNRIKRLVRESFRRHLDEVKDCEIIFVAQGPIRQLDNKRIFAMLDGIWCKLACLKKASSRP